MKISSASKKVLASALSAAMVVAFAPTVAMGVPTGNASGQVKVVYNANGGVAAPAGLDDEMVTVTKTTTKVTKEAARYYGMTGMSSESRADNSKWTVKAVAEDFFTDAEWTSLLTNGFLAKGGATYIIGVDGSTNNVYVQDDAATSGFKYIKAAEDNVAGVKTIKTTTDVLTAATIPAKNPGSNVTYTKNGAPQIGWFIDLDGDGAWKDADSDGAYDAGEDEPMAVLDGAIDVMDLAASTEVVTLKALYGEIALASTGIQLKDSNDNNVNYIVPSVTDTAKAVVTATPNYLAKGNYKLVATVNGTDYYSSPFTVSSVGTGSAQTVKVPQSAITAGDIALKVINADTGADVAGATGTVTLCSVTYDAGTHGIIKDEVTGASSAAKTVIAAKGTTYGNIKAAAPTVTAGTGWAGKSAGWAKADGTEVPADSEQVKTNLNLVMQWQEAGVQSVTYTQAEGIKFSANYLNSTDAALDKYQVTIAKDGVELISAKVAPNAAIAGTVVFGQNYDYVSGSTYNLKAKAEAGTYTVTIAPVYKTGKTSDIETVSKAVTVEAITYDANGGKIKAEGDAGYDKTAVTTIQSGALLSTVIADTTVKPAWLSNDDSTKKFAGWSVDGTTVAKPGKVTANGTVALKAIWKDAYVAKPTLASATMTTENNVDKWALVFADATEGATMTFAIDGKASGNLPATGIIGLLETDKVTVTAKPAAGSSLEANAEVFYGYKRTTGTVTPTTTLNNFAVTVLNAETAESQVSKRAYYSGVESVKASQAAAVAALKAVGFATEKDWGKAVTAQERTILEAAVAYANSEIDAKTVLTKSKDGKTYSFISEADADTAKKALEQVLADFDGFAAATAEKPYTAKALKAAGTVVTNTAADYIAAITYAVTSAKVSTVAADVAEGAIAVSEQLKAATTAEAAQAALAAYAALNDAQKELVAVADVAAAQAVVKAAAEAEAAAQLVKEQDVAAVKYVNSTKTKTVKLATAKKGTASITYKSKVSASGNTVTYKKVSGAKIKVAASGKVTLKKVTKAGTYTGKVKVTCGDAKRTVKVKFIVK